MTAHATMNTNSCRFPCGLRGSVRRLNVSSRPEMAGSRFPADVFDGPAVAWHTVIGWPSDWVVDVRRLSLSQTGGHLSRRHAENSPKKVLRPTGRTTPC